MYARFHAWLRGAGLFPPQSPSAPSRAHLVISDAHAMRAGDVLRLLRGDRELGFASVTLIADARLEAPGSGASSGLVPILRDLASSQRGGIGGATWSLELVDELAEYHNAHVRQAVVRLMNAGEAAPAWPSVTIASRTAGMPLPPGLAYVQAAAAAPAAAPGGIFAVGIPAGADHGESLASLLVAAAAVPTSDSSFAAEARAAIAALRAASTVGVVCRSGAQARAIAHSLRSALALAPPQRSVEVVSSVSVRLTAVPEVRVLLAAMGILTGAGASLEALYLVLTSTTYRMPHGDFASLVTPDAATAGAGPVSFSEAALQPSIFGSPAPPGELGPLSLPRSIEDLLERAAAGASSATAGSQLETSNAPRRAPAAARVFLDDLVACRAELARTGSLAAAAAVFCRRAGWEAALGTGSGETDAALAATLDVLAQCEDGDISSRSMGAGDEGGPTSAASSSSDDDDELDTSAGAAAAAASLSTAALAQRSAAHVYVAASARIVAGAEATTGGGADFDAELESRLLAPELEAAMRGVSGSCIGGDGSAAGADTAAPAQLVVVTTMARALQRYLFDALVLPNFSDSSLPGRFTTPAVSSPASLFKHSAQSLMQLASGKRSASEGGSGAGGNALAADLTPEPQTREAHAGHARQRLKLLCTRTRSTVVVLEPDSQPRAALAAERRSRLVDELIGALPPRAQALPSAKATPVSAPAEAAASLSSEGSLPPTALSISRMTEYAWCPRRYQLSREARLPGTGSLARIYGSALHAGVAAAGALLAARLLPLAPQPPSPPLLPPPARSDAAAVEAAASSAAVAEAVTPPGADFTPSAMADVRAALRLAAALSSKDSSSDGAQLAARVRSVLPSRDELAAAVLEAYRATWVQPELPHPFLAPASVAPGGSGPAAARTSCTPAQYAALERAAVAAAARIADAELAAVSASPPRVPALVEAPFTLARAAPPGADRDAAAGGGGGGFAISGVIDRVDAVGGSPAGAAPSLLVREFKSGAPWRRGGRLDRTPMGSVQVELYVTALAGALASAPAASTAIAVAGQVESIETGDVVPARRRRATTADGKLELPSPLDNALLAAARGISARRFHATPSLIKCAFCSVRDACDSAAA